MSLYAYPFLFRLVKAKRIFLPLSLSFLFTFSINVLRSGRGLAGLFATVVAFLLLVIGVYCSTNSGVKPSMSWVTYPPAPFPWVLMKGRGLGKGGGFAPSLKSPPPLLVKERGIKGVRLTNAKGGNR